MLVIDVLPGVHCVLVESHEREGVVPHGTQRGRGCERALVQNLQVHLRLGPGATLQHLRIVAPGAEDRIAHHVARQRRPRLHATHQALIASGSGYHLQRTRRSSCRARKAEARSAAVLFAAGSALEQQVRVAHGARIRRAASRRWRWRMPVRVSWSTRTAASRPVPTRRRCASG